MESLQIEETEYTPAVHFEETNLSIKGKSLPENAKLFYEQLINWLSEFGKSKPSRIRLGISLSYFNSSSSKQLLKLFYVLEDLQENGCDVAVQWNVNNQDEMIIDKGEEFRDLLEIDFKIN